MHKILNGDLPYLSDRLQTQMISGLRVVAEFSDELPLALLSLLHSSGIDLIAEDPLCLIHYTNTPFLRS